MPNTAEIVEKLSRQIERYKLLDMAADCETLEEFIEKLKAIIESK